MKYKCYKCGGIFEGQPETCPHCGTRFAWKKPNNGEAKLPATNTQQQVQKRIIPNIPVPKKEEHPVANVNTNYEYSVIKDIENSNINFVLNRQYSLFGWEGVSKELSFTTTVNNPITVTRDPIYGSVDENGNISLYGGDVHVSGGGTTTYYYYNIDVRRDKNNENYNLWLQTEYYIDDVMELRSSLGHFYKKHLFWFIVLFALSIFLAFIGAALAIYDKPFYNGADVKNNLIAGIIIMALGFVAIFFTTWKIRSVIKFNRVHYKHRLNLLSAVNNDLRSGARAIQDDMTTYVYDAYGADLSVNVTKKMMAFSNDIYTKTHDLFNNPTETKFTYYSTYLKAYTNYQHYRSVCKFNFITSAIIGGYWTIALLGITLQGEAGDMNTLSWVIMITLLVGYLCIFLIPGFIGLAKKHKNKKIQLNCLDKNVVKD